MKELYSPKDIVHSGLCIGCGSCVAQSRSGESFMKFDRFGQLKPYGSFVWYKERTESFSTTCPFSPSAKNEDYLSGQLFPPYLQNNIYTGRYISNFAGYVLEEDFRSQGSSGGMVSWIASELLRKGLVDGVAHVIAAEDPQTEGRFFKYNISHNRKEILKGAKSRYYPVELSDVLRIIREVPGRYAITGVPCMIKAINLLRMKDPVYFQRICFSLGLFCGHMKSSCFLESFITQMNIPLQNVKQVDFRYKYPDRPANWYNIMVKLHDGREMHGDWWHLADGDWGAGFFMNSACNFCDDVVAETADISFGDAWAEPYSSDGRGTNVIVVRSSVINEFVSEGIREGRLKLEEVTPDFIFQTQAAGFRQRREGLAYRLTWLSPGIKPVKRVAPDSRISGERKIIYRIRYNISKWSHVLFRFSGKVHMKALYIFWARSVTAVYYGLAYHRGSPARMKKRFIQLGR